MSAQEIVRTIIVPVTVHIYRYPHAHTEAGWMYDWRASNGDEPDEWFETEEEAVADARNRY